MVSSSNSYVAKLLRIDLTRGQIATEDVPERIVFDFVGGRGFGAKYLYDELRPGIDPLSPDNKLVFSVGPLAGTPALACSRWIVTSKSPLTGTYYRSVSGADFGAWLRFAGLDMIIVEGKADKPVYIYIEAGRSEIRDAGELWGKDTIETQERLKQVHGKKTTSACIGTAGEKLVRYALILNERRAAGRGGIGTVMGSKNLKAIAINATGPVKLPNLKEFKGLVKEEVLAHRASPNFARSSQFGTTTTTDAMNPMGVFPTRNFREGCLEDWENITSSEYAKIKVGDTTCYACMISCGNIFTVANGPYTGATSQPEYETINMFTGSIGSADIGATIVADYLCDEMGIDTISAGNSIGFAYELFERGILTRKDTDGLELTYGNHQAALELLKKIGNREGLGDILAEGVKQAAEHIGKGAEAYAMHVKGLEIPGYDPRAVKWHGLNYITSPCGANHNIGYGRQEILNVPIPRAVDRFADEGFADCTKENQDHLAMIEVAVCCEFLGAMLPDPLLARMLASATGISAFSDKHYLLRTGERVFNLERAFNIREGFSRKDDAFPKRFTTEPLKNAGPAEGQLLKNIDGMLDEYYQVRGWDRISGKPLPETLKSLGLDYIISDIW